MAVQVQCPSCGTIYSVFEAAVGRRVRCPDCQKLVVAERYQPPAGGDAQSLRDTAEEIVDLVAVEEEPVPLAPISPAGALPPGGLPLDATPPAWEEEEELRAAAPTGRASDDLAVAVPAPPPPPASPPPAPAAEPTERRRALIFRRDRQRPEAEMDMTPMVDVTFQLLIFFMLTASFAMQKSLQVPKPERAGPSAVPRTVAEFVENPDYVVVRVDANNTFYVNAGAFAEEVEAPTEPELMVKLRQARQGDGRGNIPTKMLVVAHGDALHDRVVSAIDAGNDVGMEEVQLVTVEDE